MPNKPTYLHCLKHGVITACVIFGAVATALGATATTDTVRDFDLPAGMLADALRDFSEQSGIALVYDQRIVNGRNANPVEGPLISREALTSLLEGSSLIFQEINEKTVAIIERSPPPAPEPKVLTPPPAYSPVDEIIVTASYRAPSLSAHLRTDYSLDGEAMQLSGAQNVAEPILELPATVASVTSANTALMATAGGLNLADLRGLRPERTLVTINGRRFIRTSGGNGAIYGVDLNTIPTAFIDRIDIIYQGAGASLGADAVGGVINIVTRDHIDGVSLTLDGGLSERGDAGEYQASILAGTPFAGGRGKLSVGAAIASDASLFLQDRPYLSQPYGFGRDGFLASPSSGEFLPGYGGSINTPAGSVAGAVTSEGDVVLLPPDAFLALNPNGSSFEPFKGRLDQLYNWTTGFAALPEIKRQHVMAASEYEISSRFTGKAEIFYAHTQTNGQVAAAPVVTFRGNDPAVGDGLVVAADHPGAPPGLRQAVESRIGAPIDSFLINRRTLELGPRSRDIRRQSLQANLILKGGLDNGWDIDLAYQFGLSNVRDIGGALADGDRLAIALDPTQCNATPGCLPVNIFAADTISPQASEFYRVDNETRRLKTREHGLRASATSLLYTLGDLEGRLSLGSELRRDRLISRSPPHSADRTILASFDFADVDGAVTYWDTFADAQLPLLAETGLAESLTVSVAGRAMRWSDGGIVGNISADLSWRPIDGVELYASALHGARAPNIIELSTGGARSAFPYFDPCQLTDAPIIAENCATTGPLGAPAGLVQQNALVISEYSGNPDLEAEKIRSRHFGVAFDFHELADLGDDQLRLSADWRRHAVSHVIGNGEINAVLLDCYESKTLSSPYCGKNPATGKPVIQRDPTSGQIVAVNIPYGNDGDLLVTGLDANLAYQTSFDWAPLTPDFSLDVLYSFTNHARERKLLARRAEELVGLAQFPRHQIYATASLEADAFKTIWTVRRRGAALSSLQDAPSTRLPAKIHVDAGVQYQLDAPVIIYGGVENLLDTKVPIGAYAERGFYTEHYDPVGRRYFMGLRIEF